MSFTPNTDDLCLCGCGSKVGVWERNDTIRGRAKGVFKKYLAGHRKPPSFKGRARSLEDRLKKSIAAKKRVLEGRHNFYLGGISNEWANIRNSFEYKTWHRMVFERDRFCCVMCGKKGGWNKREKCRNVLHADHIKPKAIYPELIFDIDNGRTLCKECHLLTPTWGGRTTYAKRF